MITRLYLENFRAFEKLDIPLSKINLFFGPNNSGKSAIISAINVMSQTLDSADRSAPLLLNGKFEELGSYWDAVYQHEENRDIRLGIEFVIPEERREPLTSNSRINVKFHYRPQRREIVAREIILSNPPPNILLKTRVATTSDSQLVEESSPRFQGIKVGAASSQTILLNHFIPYVAPTITHSMFDKRNRRTNAYRGLDFTLYCFDNFLRQQLQNVQFIGPFRNNPQRTYVYSGGIPSSVGVSGDKAIDILAADESRRLGKKKNISEMVSKWFKDAGIASEFEIVPFSDRHFEIFLTHIHTGESVNIADAGYGCSQILPILVAGYYIQPNSLFIVAEPEIHLHPKAEAEVGTFLYTISKKPIQIIVESHSEHLLLRLQSYVASGEISPEEINIFYVYSDEKANQKHCTLIPLGRDGYFTEKWPKGFFPERFEEAKRLAKYSV